MWSIVRWKRRPTSPDVELNRLTPRSNTLHSLDTDRGVSIVRPDVPVRVVVFGFWLDELSAVSFVSSSHGSANCSAASSQLTFSQTEFVIQTDKRMVVTVAFLSTPHGDIYHLCIRRKSSLSSGFSQVSDLRTWVSTDVPPRIYYFPFYVQVVVISCLLVLSGLFSGLNLGLMALTPPTGADAHPEIGKRSVTTPNRFCRCVNGEIFCSALFTLLIGNVCVNSGISILFDDLTSGYVAFLVSSAGIVVCGEIFPQSLCVKKGLAVGAKTIMITRFFMILTFPIAYPISKLLDVILGEEVTSYDRKRLMELMKMSSCEGLQEELKIAVGAMEISDKIVADVMTRVDDVFMLPVTTVLNTKTVAEILRMGYTRIPVFSDLVKTYIMDLRHPLGLRMANKFRGAGSAIELGYLKEFMVVVSQNEENPDDAIEVFTWKMVYGEDGYVMAQFTDGDQKVLATLRYQGMEKVKEQTRALLMLVRRLCRNILEPLPSDAFAMLRVTYTDKTPKGYQAKGFYRSETLYDLSPDAKEVILGGVASAHHRCILSAKSVYVEDEYTVQERLNGSDEYSDDSLNNSFTGAEA